MEVKNNEPAFLEIKDEFYMRELDRSDLEQFNALLQYAFQVTSYDLFQTGWQQDEIKYAKRPILEEAYVLGWFYKEKLASMIVVYSMKVNIHDEIMDMGGITGVATYPEYTGRGLIHSLMKHALNYMHEQQMSISFLYPYSIPLYRKMGWEIVSDKLSFTVKDTQLPKPRPVTGMVERVSLDSEDYHNVHSYFALQRHGCLIRDSLSWEEYWRWDNDDMIAAVYYNQSHKPLGYVVYYIANDIFHIKEMVYLNIEANYGLWNYISAHFSMIDQVQGDNYSGEPMATCLKTVRSRKQSPLISWQGSSMYGIFWRTTLIRSSRKILRSILRYMMKWPPGTKGTIWCHGMKAKHCVNRWKTTSLSTWWNLTSIRLPLC